MLIYRPFSLKNETVFERLLQFKASMFDKFKFPEVFGRSGAEDTLFQIKSHLEGKIFLYSPLVKGLHDHDLNFRDICRKLFYEIKGVGILLNYSAKRGMRLPFQYCFLSYPLLFMLGLFATILNRFFAAFLITAVVLEIILSSACLRDKQTGVVSRFEAFIYCLLGEIIKGFYLPFCVIYGAKFNFMPVFKQLLYWEKMKFRFIFK